MNNGKYARVAELVDARDLKSLDQKSCGFDSRLAHQIVTKAADKRRLSLWIVEF